MGKYGSILHKQTSHVILHTRKHHKCYGNDKKCYPEFRQNNITLLRASSKNWILLHYKAAPIKITEPTEMKQLMIFLKQKMCWQQSHCSNAQSFKSNLTEHKVGWSVAYSMIMYQLHLLCSIKTGSSLTIQSKKKKSVPVHTMKAHGGVEA